MLRGVVTRGFLKNRFKFLKSRIFLVFVLVFLSIFFIWGSANFYLFYNYILGNDAAEVLLEHNWPGNVRELENVIQRALVLSEEPILSASTIFIQQSGTPASLQSTESYLLSKVG